MNSKIFIYFISYLFLIILIISMHFFLIVNFMQQKNINNGPRCIQLMLKIHKYAEEQG